MPGSKSSKQVGIPACVTCGQPGCAGLFDEMTARHFERPALYRRCHRLAVDAYCVQHDPYVDSAKSLAAHLCGLCIALEQGGDERKMRRIQQWLSRNPNLRKPDLPKFRGARTIAHLQGMEDLQAYAQAVVEWAQSAWDAYHDLHALAREWIAQAEAIAPR